MDNPWGSPWAADEPASAAPAASPSASPLPTLARLPSPDGLAAPGDFRPSAVDDDDGGWGGSLNDGGWGGAEDVTSGGCGATSSPAQGSSSDEGTGRDPMAAEVEVEPLPASISAFVAGEASTADDEAGFASTTSPVPFTPPTPPTSARPTSPPTEASPFASPPPSAPLSHNSSIPSSRPLSPTLTADDSPGAFASSDSFDDFAPFSSPPAVASPALAGADDDPWGATASFDDAAGDDAWASSTTVRADADESDVAWSIEPAVRNAAPTPEIVEDEWAEARRRAALRAQRAPREVIERLVGQWSDVAAMQYPAPAASSAGPIPAAAPTSPEGADNIGSEESTQLPAAQTSESEEPVTTEVDDHLNLRLEDLRNIADLLPRMLAPPSSTALAYPSSATHAQFIAALRHSLRLPNSASLLNTGRARPFSSTAGSLAPAASPQSADEWWDRSRLGEEEDRVETAGGGEEKRGWFGAWSRRSSAQPTSVARGGSVDVGGSKTPDAVDKLSSVAGPPLRPSVDRAASPAPLVQQPTATASSHASPRTSLSLGSESPKPSVVEPSAEAGSAAPPAPSAVSRFLGRFGRKPAAAADPVAPSAKSSLELSAGDFDFLAEVRGSEPTGEGEDDGLSHDQGDFLSGFGVPVVARGKQAALDDFLNSKPSVALPKPLAPPPGRAPSRTSSAASQQGPAQTGMDDLSFLTFDSPSTPRPQSASANISTFDTPGASNGGNDDWDAFMADPIGGSTTGDSSTRVGVAPVPVLAPPLAPSRSGSPALQPSKATSTPRSPASSSPLAFAASTSSAFAVPATTHSHNDDDDFGDFDSAPAATFPARGRPVASDNSIGFDDFAAFESAPAVPSARLPFSAKGMSPFASAGDSGSAPEPPTQSPHHAQDAVAGASSRWPPLTRATNGFGSPLAPPPPPPPPPSSSATSATALRQGPPATSPVAASGGSVSSHNMASLVSHARTASQTTHRGWMTTTTTTPADSLPLPAPLAPPPPPPLQKSSGSLLDDDEPLGLALPPASAAAAPHTTAPPPLSSTSVARSVEHPVLASSTTTMGSIAPALTATTAFSTAGHRWPGASQSGDGGGAGEDEAAPSGVVAMGSRPGLTAADLDFFDGL